MFPLFVCNNKPFDSFRQKNLACTGYNPHKLFLFLSFCEAAPSHAIGAAITSLVSSRLLYTIPSSRARTPENSRTAIMRKLIHSLVGITGILSVFDSSGLAIVNAFTTTTTYRPLTKQQAQQQQQEQRTLSSRWNVALQAAFSASNNNNNNNNNPQQQPPLVRSRLPHQLSNGRGTFLGFRNTKDVPGLCSSVSALMPDGGLSPCVIRVLGVGGGGCNAVRILLLLYYIRVWCPKKKEATRRTMDETCLWSVLPIIMCSQFSCPCVPRSPLFMVLTLCFFHNVRSP